MIYPDTLEAAVGRILERIDLGADELSRPPQHYDEDDEQRDFRQAAEAGARAYAEKLRHQLAEQEPITEELLDEAELVATAAQCSGWLGSVIGRDGAMGRLQKAGVFVFHPARPEEYVACVRLVAPC